MKGAHVLVLNWISVHWPPYLAKTPRSLASHFHCQTLDNPATVIDCYRVLHHTPSHRSFAIFSWIISAIVGAHAAIDSTDVIIARIFTHLLLCT